MFLYCVSTVEERKKMQEYNFKVVVQAALGAANKHSTGGERWRYLYSR